MKYLLLFLFTMVIWSYYSDQFQKKRMTHKLVDEYFGSSVRDTFAVTKLCKLRYVEFGQSHGPTLVFVHGSPGSWEAFVNYLKDPEMLAQYRMIAIDRPGFGYSNFGQPYNLTKQAEILSEFLVSVVDGSSVTLVGHSYGGPLISIIAAKRPELVNRLVILAGALDPGAETPELWRWPGTLPLIRSLVPGALKPANIELWWLKKDLVRLQPHLNKIQACVEIVHAVDDDLVPYSNVNFMQRELTGASVSVTTLPTGTGKHKIPQNAFLVIKEILMQN